LKDKIIIIIGIIGLLTTPYVFKKYRKQAKIVKLTHEDLLILTKSTFVQGYKAGWLKQDRDTVWSRIEKEFRHHLN
jgi:hypothetical protein